MIIREDANISEISRIEILGYHKLKTDEENYFQYIFDLVPVILPSQQIFDTAIQIRRQFNLKLGDSLIAATALVTDLTICTRNLGDFEKISYLKCSNPVK